VGFVSNVICRIQLRTAAAFGSELKLICALFQSGGECMVLPTLKYEEANNLFPKSFSVIISHQANHIFALLHS
jgi:hypothetical protein